MDNDVVMREVVDPLVRETKASPKKRATSTRKSSGRSSSKRAVRTVSNATAVKATTGAASSTTTTTPPPVPTITASAPAPAPATQGGDSVIVGAKRPLKIKRRMMDSANERDSDYYIVSDINDKDGQLHQIPRYIVVRAVDLPSAQGMIRNLLDKEGLLATNPFAPETANVIMGTQTMVWIETGGDDMWDIGEDANLIPEDVDAPILFGAYDFPPSPTMSKKGVVASTIFALAKNDHDARRIIDHAFKWALHVTSPSYQLAELTRVTGAQIIFPPNLSS